MRTNWEEIKDSVWSKSKTNGMTDLHKRLKVVDETTGLKLFWEIRNQTDTATWLPIRNQVWRQLSEN